MNNPDSAATTPNPLLADWTGAFGLPPFGSLTPEHFRLAFDRALAAHRAELDAISANPEKPTFDNTIVALEKSGRMLDRVLETFYAVVQANTNPTLDKVQTAEAPRLAAHQDAIFLNPKLFARVKALYEKRGSLKLDPEAAQVLKLYYQQFIHSGANLAAADQARLKEINKEDASLQAEFQQRLVAGTKDAALALGDKAALEGLSDGEIATAAHAAQERGMKGGYLIVLQNTTQQPLLTDLADRDTREKLFNKSWTRTERGDRCHDRRRPDNS